MNRVKHFLILVLAMMLSLGAWASDFYISYSGTWPASAASHVNTQNKLVLTFEPSTLVSEVKQNIADYTGFSVSGMTLSYGSFSNMADDHVIIDYNVGKGSTIVLEYNAPATGIVVTQDNNLDWTFTMPDYDAVVSVEFYPSTLTLAANGNGSVILTGINGNHFEVPSNWENDDTTTLTAADLPGFSPVTAEQALTWSYAPTNGITRLIYGFDGQGHPLFANFASGSIDPNSPLASYNFTYTHGNVFDSAQSRQFYYTSLPNGVAAATTTTKTLIFSDDAESAQYSVANATYPYHINVNTVFAEVYPDYSQVTVHGSHLSYNEGMITVSEEFTGVEHIEFTKPGSTPIELDLHVRVNTTSNVIANTYVVDYGTDVTVKATAVEGNYVSSWSNNAEINSLTEATQTLTLTEDLTLTGNFAAQPVLTLASNGNGTVELEGANVNTGLPAGVTANTARENSDITLNSNNSFGINSSDFYWSGTQMGYDVGINDGATGQIKASASTDAAAQIEGISFTISYGSAPTSFEPAGMTVSQSGSQLTLSDIPAGTRTITITNNTGDQTRFSAIAVTYSVPVPVANQYRVLPGTTVTINATADVNNHYHFVNWTNENSSAYTAGVSTDTEHGNYPQNSQLTLTVTGDTTTRGNFSIDTYTITAIANSDAGGTVSGGGTYSYNTGVTLIATPAMGYHFVNWTNNLDNTISTNNPLEFTVTQAITYTANFAQTPVLTLASNDATMGSVTLSGTTLPNGVTEYTENNAVVNGKYYVLPGTELTVNATAATLHHVAGWQNEDGDAMATAAYSDYFVTSPSNLFPAKSTLTFTMAGDTTAKAIFGINSYDVTAQVAATADVRGTVRIAYTDVQGAAQVSDSLATVTASAQGGSTATLTAYPAWGYHFVKWQNQNGDSLSAQNPLSVTSAVDTVLVAVFDTTKAELSWSADEFTGYTMINFNNDKPTIRNPHNVSVRYGLAENINSVKVNPETGYITNNFNVPRLTTQGTYHIYAVHETDQTYFYDSVVYTLNVNWGAVVSILKNINEGGSTAFLNAEDNLTHAYSSSNNTMMAFLAPGASFTAAATANEGYHFSKWQTGGNNAGYTDFATTSEATYTAPAQIASLYSTDLKAVFDTNTYNVTYSVQKDTRETIGTGQAMGTVTLEGRHMHFLNDKLTATADYGYTFDGWKNEQGNVVSTANPLTFSPVSDTTLQATFTVNNYTLTSDLAIATSGEVTGAGNYPYLTNVTLEATVNTGYHFVNWTDLSGIVLNGNALNPTTLTVQVLGDTTVVAVMDTNTYALKVTSVDAAMGSGNGSTTAKHFLHYEISATPNTGYHFWQWNDDSIANPRTVTLISDSAFTAIFAPDTFTITYMDGDVELKVDTFYYLQPITEYTLSREKWRFDGWDPVVPQLMPAENMTVYAQWYRICDSLQDYDGNEYASVNISNKCWMTENLRTRHYIDGRLIANIYEYQTILNPTVPQNYGLLYGWEDAVDANKPATRAASSVSPTYIQGVCPTGWHIPTAEEAAVLINLPTVALCSTDGWIAPDGNTNSTNFSAYPAGLYNAVLDRFEELGTEADWWIVNGASNNTQNYSSLQIPYFCNTPQIVTRNPNDAVSVRCVLND